MDDAIIKTKIIRVLSTECCGRDNAITNITLAAKIGEHKDKVRQLCGDIVREKQTNIGSHPDRGFFIIVDQEDYDLSQRNLKSRVSEIAKRFHAAEEMWIESRQEQMGQGRMFIRQMQEMLVR